jgi:LSD1 subclass zinc finger protein
VSVEVLQVSGVWRRPVVAARVNWGRWIVDCPACPSALALAPGAPVLRCWDCAAVAEVAWPDDELRDGVERLLAVRPSPHTRNWTPGETLHDLLAENIAHDVVAGALQRLAELGAAPAGGRLYLVEGDRLTVDALTAPLELARAEARREIGA